MYKLTKKELTEQCDGRGDDSCQLSSLSSVTLSLSASALEREYERIALRLVAVDGILRQPAVIISTA